MLGEEEVAEATDESGLDIRWRLEQQAYLPAVV